MQAQPFKIPSLVAKTTIAPTTKSDKTRQETSREDNLIETIRSFIQK
jgi:hypothetical protein